MPHGLIRLLIGSLCSFRQLLLFKTGSNILASDRAISTMLLTRFANASAAFPIALFRSFILSLPPLYVSIVDLHDYLHIAYIAAVFTNATNLNIVLCLLLPEILDRTAVVLLHFPMI